MSRTDPRERILEAAMDAIAERGMAGLRMEDVGRRVGMSPGHILYYYRSKQRLLLETLRWSEARLAGQRASELPALPTAWQRLERFIAIYLPSGARQANWLLWLQAWALAPEDPEAATVTAEQQALWAKDLAGIVEYGQAQEEFTQSDSHWFAEEFLSVLRGFSLHILHDGPVLDRERLISAALEIAGFRLGVVSDRPPERPCNRD